MIDSADLTSDILLQAYVMGVFPMAESREDTAVFWVDPRRRGVLPLEGFRVSRSLARSIRRNGFKITFNHGFSETVRACADRPETWINDVILDLYDQLHERGFAHSLEVWDNDRLVGGVYGVALGGAFFGESMFSRSTDASKTALAYLVPMLHSAGFSLFDTQFLTDHLKSLGAVEIARAEYHARLKTALSRGNTLIDTPIPTRDQVLLQRRTQTS